MRIKPSASDFMLASLLIPILDGIDWLLKTIAGLWIGCCGLALLWVLIAGTLGLVFGGSKEKHKPQRKRAERGTGYILPELARRLDLPETDLQAVPVDYAERFIPKRRGGTRQLQVPNPQLKHLQRRIARRLLKRLRVHPAAVGFEPGLSIAHNAGMHVGKAVVIKMDIVDFFPSTTASRVEWYFRRIGWDAEAATLLAKLTTHEGGLPQGAPTSPRLSIHVRHKLRVVRQHQQQRVTGLVVNEKVQLPREKRRWLRAVEHRLKTTGRASLTPEQLAGWKALQQMIARQTGRPPEVIRESPPEIPPDLPPKTPYDPM